MIIPLELIFSGGDDDSKDLSNFTTQTGGAVNEIFSKKCEEIKNKYGIPIGYSCIITQNINYNSNYNSNIHNIDEEIREIDDDMFDTLFTLASNEGEQSPTTRKVSAIRKTKRSIEKPKKHHVTKKKSRNTKNT